ncbi:MAG: alpha/beta fold hydrolase [Leptolinea sp.]|jgi:carboxylesterase|nr:alpha/beta fold hydrolase [Leptolinea sp.]
MNDIQSTKMPSDLFNPQFDGGSFFIPGSSTGVLLFHGFTATALEVRGLAEYLHDHLHCTISAPLLPGHGTSPEILAGTKYLEWIEKAESAYLEMTRWCDQIFIGGESMGGLLSLYLASRHPEIAGLMLFAPALIIPSMSKARFFQYFFFSSPKKLTPTLPGYLPWQGYRVNPLKAVVELGRFQDIVMKELPGIQQPMLVFQGLQDETIDINSSRIIVNTVGSGVKDLVELENCGHCILLDNQREPVYKRALSFIKSLPDPNE